jgi:hypothetical protein
MRIAPGEFECEPFSGFFRHLDYVLPDIDLDLLIIFGDHTHRPQHSRCLYTSAAFNGQPIDPRNGPASSAALVVGKNLFAWAKLPSILRALPQILRLSFHRKIPAATSGNGA